MNERNFSLLTSTELARIRAVATEAVEEWRGSWVTMDVPVAVAECRAGEELKSAHVDLINEALGIASTNTATGIFVLASREECARLAGVISGCEQSNGSESPTSELMRMLGEAACSDLIRHLLTEMGGGVDDLEMRTVRSEVDPSLLKSGVGTIFVDIQISVIHLVLLISGQRVMKWLKRSTQPSNYSAVGLRSLSDAMRDRKIKLKVVVGGIDMDVSDLVSLKINDVIVLDSGLNRPVTVNLVDGGVIGRGFLGVSDGHRAVQLIANQ